MFQPYMSFCRINGNTDNIFALSGLFLETLSVRRRSSDVAVISR